MVGQTLGHYRILQKLGAGGRDDVYATEDTTLRRRVALKTLPPSLAQDPDPSRASGSSRATLRDDRRHRFERETQAVARIEHPGILAFRGRHP